MALINCPNCRHKVSDKASFCPKCGHILDSPTMQIDNNDNEKYRLNDEPKSPKRSRLLKWLLVLLAIFLIGDCVAYYFYIDNRTKREAALAEAARLDSIAAAEREAARLEALRQDSIRRDSLFRNFQTPDLIMCDLHGRVKTMSGGALVWNVFDDKSDGYSFDENGTCKKRRPDDYFLGFKYDKSGRIVECKYVEGGGCPQTKISWKNGKVAEIYDSYGSHCTNTKYIYDGEGRLIEENYEERANQGVHVSTKTIYKILEEDKWGNLTKRQAITKGVSSYEQYDENEPSGYHTVKEQINKNETESRTITYYDRSEIENNVAATSSSKEPQTVEKTKKKEKKQSAKKAWSIDSTRTH